MTAVRHLLRMGKAAGNAFAEMLAPRHCELCAEHLGNTARRFEFVCNSCLDNLEPAPYPAEIYNQIVGRFSGDDLALSAAAALYTLSDDPPLSHLLYALKYKGRSRIGLEFGRELGRTLAALGITAFDSIVPVPIHPARMRERGFNQAERIAAGVAAVLDLPLALKAVKRRVYTPSQTSLSADERMLNIRGAFAPATSISELQGHSVLLIDDIFTTGSTLNACATVALEHGAERVEAATLAFTR